MIDVRAAARRQRRRADGGAAASRSTCTAAPPSRPTRRRPTSCASPTWSRSPPPDEAPSNLAIIGRYVLDPVDLRRAARDRRRAAAARSSSPTRCSELAAAPASTGGGVHGVVFRGRRYDTGDRLDYLKAVVRLACERDDLGPGLQRLAGASSSTGAETLAAEPVKSGRASTCADILDGVGAAARRIDLAAARRARLRPGRGRRRPTSTCPPFDNSAMDGYAVRVGRRRRAPPPTHPVHLPVVGDIAAGSTDGATRSRPGTAVRIMTGAPLPRAPTPSSRSSGPTAASPRSRITRAPELGAARPAPRRGRRDRRRGARRPAPARARASSACSPRSAAAGCWSRPRPRVVVISTGAELRRARARRSATARSTTRNSLHAHRRRARGRARSPTGSGIVPDDAARAAATRSRTSWSAPTWWSPAAGSAWAPTTWSRRCSSPARHGRVRQGRDAAGQAAGLRRRRRGRAPRSSRCPATRCSSYVSFEVFVLPAMRRMIGSSRRTAARACRGRRTQATGLAAGRAAVRPRAAAASTAAARVVGPVGGHGSHLIGDLAAANALVVVPADVTARRRGRPAALQRPGARCDRATLSRRPGPAADPRRRDRRGPDGRRVGQGRHRARGGRGRPGAACRPTVVAAAARRGRAQGRRARVARIAGIMAAKRTPDLVPLCHPIAIHGVDGRPRGRRRRRRDHARRCAPPTAPASRWRR